MKTKIYRRFFNPNKEKGEVKVRQLVATFPSYMEEEAKACFARLQALSIDFKQDTYFSKFRYELEAEPTPIESPSDSPEIQIDLSKATPTKRPISFQLGWHKEHGECHMLAHHPNYGCIRGVVEDSPSGRRLFMNRLSTVWPNAEVK